MSVSNYIAQNPESNISVVGHTDSQGTTAYNEQLSAARANFVTKSLELRINCPKMRFILRGYDS